MLVVGGGPAGSTLAWDLARRGVRVTVLERAGFPREKVCGDYVEPRGLRILRTMGTLERLEERGPLPISHSATYVDWECRYRGEIPFYGLGDDLPPHGYIVARDELDDAMLRTAAEAGATVHEETSVTSVDAGPGGVTVEAKRGTKTVRYRAKLVAGADGVNSVVARDCDLAADDSRRVAVAQRAYATVDGDVGEAAFFFAEDLFPGYGLTPYVVQRESMGFIFNRVWAAIKRETLAVVAEGVASPEVVDAIYCQATGMKPGPFRLMDAVGLDVVLSIEDNYAQHRPGLPEGPRILLKKMIAEGRLGVKSGRGFYNYQ